MAPCLTNGFLFAYNRNCIRRISCCARKGEEREKDSAELQKEIRRVVRAGGSVLWISRPGAAAPNL